MDQVAKRVATMIVNSHLATVLLLYLFVIYPMKSQLSRVFKLMLLSPTPIGTQVVYLKNLFKQPLNQHPFENLSESRRASRRNKSSHQSLGFF